MAGNAGYDDRTKHLDISHHFVRKIVESGIIKVDYVDTKNQLSGLLTKARTTKTLKFLRDASGIKTKDTMQ